MIRLVSVCSMKPISGEDPNDTCQFLRPASASTCAACAKRTGADRGNAKRAAMRIPYRYVRVIRKRDSHDEVSISDALSFRDPATSFFSCDGSWERIPT